MTVDYLERCALITAALHTRFLGAGEGVENPRSTTAY